MHHYGTTAFETERLICRRFEKCDAEDMYRNWASDPMVQAGYGEPVYSSMEAAMALAAGYVAGYQNPDFYRWAIIEKQSGENIGQIAFCRVYAESETAEIEYCIGRKYWGNGYAGEALEGLIDHTFANIGFRKLEAFHRAENIKSGKVLARSSMHRTDMIERFADSAEVPEGEVCYCILKGEYQKRECTDF